ncbi:hypothetical protein NQ318_008224 [Aromia moschata]|uniref:WW domain-containing protein n=1 Tax=Aromia moschata TaxID=1265417 RepID=A0AAV8YL46_9CUCU|nr:hypothetical protein NQ318_008224 [Aromia moschata]
MVSENFKYLSQKVVELGGEARRLTQHCYEEWKNSLQRYVTSQESYFEGENTELSDLAGFAVELQKLLRGYFITVCVKPTSASYETGQTEVRRQIRSNHIRIEGSKGIRPALSPADFVNLHKTNKYVRLLSRCGGGSAVKFLRQPMRQRKKLGAFAFSCELFPYVTWRLIGKSVLKRLSANVPLKYNVIDWYHIDPVLLYLEFKYGSSKSYGSSSDRYERIRDSPNGNYRSDSPDSQSPRDRDRSYQSKSSYLQKIREKERENRDYKMSRDKYSDCARSPKDKRSRDAEHRSSSDRNDEKSILHPIKVSQLSSRDRKPMHNNCVDKRDDRDRVVRVGDWSEHVSSSGKKYYYNCKTEVSQWEKPREWIERERDRFRSRDRDRDRDSERSYSSSSRSGMRDQRKKLYVEHRNLEPVWISECAFADDILVLARSGTELKKSLNIWNAKLKERKLKLNVSKTKIMAEGRPDIAVNVELNGGKLEQVSTMKYLGVHIESQCYRDQEINARIQSASNMFHSMKNSFIGKKEVSIKTKMSVYNSIYVPILIFGRESWVLNQKHKSIVQSMEMKEQLQVQSVLSRIENRQLGWFGHLKRMNNDRPVKKVWEAKRQIKRRRGRPPTTWDQGIARIVESRGITRAEATTMAKNRKKWSTFVHGERQKYGHEKHSNSRGANSSSSSKDHARESATGSRHWSSSSSRDDSDVPTKESRSSRKQSEENAQSTQDMDISPGDSTPTSEVSYGNSTSQPTNEQNAMGPVLLANALPRLISHPIHVPSTPVTRPEASPQSTPASMLPAPSAVTTSNAPGPPSALASLPRIMSQPTAPADNADKNLHGLQRPGDSAVHTSLSVDTNHSGDCGRGTADAYALGDPRLCKGHKFHRHFDSDLDPVLFVANDLETLIIIFTPKSLCRAVSEPLASTSEEEIRLYQKFGNWRYL